MRKLYSIFLSLLITASVFLPIRQTSAQSPEKMSFQAVIRNASDVLVVSQAIGMQISILQGSETGTPLYVETHTPTTNSNGLVTLEIGGGTAVTGTFEGIDWSTGIYFIKTETDPAGGTDYTITGTSQILSVPYALYADSSGNGFSGSYNDLMDRPDFSLWDKDSTDNVTITGNQSVAGDKTFTGTISASNKTITNVATPVNAQDVATKAYVDNLLSIIQFIQNGVTDVDGNKYKVVLIGTQVWMAENLKTTKYSNGDEIPNITDNTAWAGLTTSAYSWYDNDVASNKNINGALYNFYAVVDSRNLCPSGWHVPIDAEFTTLTDYLINNGYGYGGSGTDIPKSMASTSGWVSNPVEGTIGCDQTSNNSSGFNGFPSGYRNHTDGLFVEIGVNASWWSSSEVSSSSAKAIHLGHGHDYVFHNENIKQRGFSVRCIKD
jgi:uncharacterized protein (TIGR02145 family)